MDAELHRPVPNFREWPIRPAVGARYALEVTILRDSAVVIHLKQVGRDGVIHSWSCMLEPQLDEEAQCLHLLHEAVRETDQALRTHRLMVSGLTAFATGISTLRILTTHLWSTLLSIRANSGMPDPPDGLTIEYSRLRHVDLTAGTLR